MSELRLDLYVPKKRKKWNTKLISRKGKLKRKHDDEDGWDGSSRNVHTKGDRIQNPINTNLSTFLTGMIENYKSCMTTGIPKLRVPILDPCVLKKPIDVSQRILVFWIEGHFMDICISGLSDFRLVDLYTDLKGRSLSIQLHIPFLKVCGKYNIYGSRLPLSRGKFSAEIHDVTVIAEASLQNSPLRAKPLQLSKKFDVKIDFNQMANFYMENFLVGSRWIKRLQTYANKKYKELFKRKLGAKLRKSLFKLINHHLMNLPNSIASIIQSPSTNELVDNILDEVKKIKSLDPMKLPDYASKLLNCEVLLRNGCLKGISSIHRSGNCKLSIDGNTVTASAQLEIANLTIQYKGPKPFYWGPSLKCEGGIENVSFRFKIEHSNYRGEKPKLKEFETVQISRININLSGFGGLTSPLNWILTGIATLVENFIKSEVTQLIKKMIDKKFQKLPAL